MKRKQLAALFVCNLTPFIVGNALLVLLPIYAIQLGADETVAGLYLSFSFGALAIGTLISGWLSNRFQRRKQMIMLAGCLCIPATFLMGQVNSIVLLTIFTMIVWFAAGVATAMVNILTGMGADSQTRGRIFGIIGISNGLAQIIGGATSGAIVDRWGYTALFTLAALVWVVQIIAGLFLENTDTVQASEDQSAPRRSPLSRAVWFLIIAHVVASTTSFSMGLGRPLMMDGLGFDASAITSVVTIGGFVALPLPFLIGWLSDRVGRNRLMIVSYLAISLSSLILISAIDLSQFWLSIAIFALGGGAVSLGFAYVTDLSTPETLGTALSRFSATPWIAGVVGFGATGFVIQALGLQTTFLLAAALPVIGIMLLFAISRQARTAPAQT